MRVQGFGVVNFFLGGVLYYSCSRMGPKSDSKQDK